MPRAISSRLYLLATRPKICGKIARLSSSNLHWRNVEYQAM
ncbi:unnamed protein product [Linum tenue]|uniref:Uncharacterized protein n=1 Tax=Linum tenue TaxID=586396 RepID=A0AAV0K7M8_9ROSI|nr:unnamed protein product [Linum tenue]